ncbi:hypothetical protein ACRQ4B_09140 [Curtobacterium sp. SP.BCo]|uniref:hypothetical protein n=1 Tax=Curtobacterium sp. SP.BCo TaxID=3435229 RepID=UPI003F73F922
MGLFRSSEDKADARERAALRRHHASPRGQAESAYVRGDALFQTSLTVDADSAATLSGIEEVGWQLEHAGYTHEISISSLSNMQNQLDSVQSSGRLIGVYLFRRR